MLLTRVLVRTPASRWIEKYPAAYWAAGVGNELATRGIFLFSFLFLLSLFEFDSFDCLFNGITDFVLGQGFVPAIEVIKTK